MSRQDMIKELVQNEIDWVVGDPTFENVQKVVEFFTGGGFGRYSDDDIKHMYTNLTA